MSGVCRCGHVDAAHFDEVLHCGACPCERFWDREQARRPRPIPNDSKETPVTVFVYGEQEARVLFPDGDGAVVQELDDQSETWFPWRDLLPGRTS
jgi:hypothetical protein